MKRLAVAAISLFVLAGCASGQGPAGAPRILGGTGGMGPEGPQEPLPGLFVSPFGELFFSEPGQPWPTAVWFAGADSNGDGRLTFEEFAADGQRWFNVLDTQRNGRLTPDEIAAYEEQLTDARARLPGLGRRGGPGRRAELGSPDTALGMVAPAQKRGRSGPRAVAPTGPLAYGPIAAAGFFNYPQPIKAADFDTNQTVTAEEWAQATERWFNSLDTDRDGILTLETLPVTPLQAMLDRAPGR